MKARNSSGQIVEIPSVFGISPYNHVRMENGEITGQVTECHQWPTQTIEQRGFDRAVRGYTTACYFYENAVYFPV